MYIIIIGCNNTGYHLAKALLAEGHEVAAIERDAARWQAAAERLGSAVIRGDGCEVAILREAGIDRADVLIAAADEDEDNLVACQMAKALFKVPQTISLVADPKKIELFEGLGIDCIISSTSLILERVRQEVATERLSHLLSLLGRGLEIVEVTIPLSSPVAGRPIRELDLPPDSLISLVTSAEGGSRVPLGDTVLEAGDQVVAVTRVETEAALRAALTGN